jgi:hypothetical protein
MATYTVALEKCEVKSTEYSLLKNGIIQRPQGTEEVLLVCSDEQAKLIFDFVALTAPEHLATIQQISDF